LNLTKLPKAVRLVIEAMQDKKASAITVLDLSSIGTFTEYFVVLHRLQHATGAGYLL